MFFVYSVPNMNPALGPAKDGKQAVSVYDRSLGNRRTVITSQEEADAFVDIRKKCLQNASKKGLIDGFLLTLAGAGIGGGIGAYTKTTEANTINALIEPLNKDYKELLDNAKLKSPLSVKFDVLNKDAYKKYANELHKLFSEDAKAFTKMDVAKVAKKAGKYGALMGAAIAAIFGLCIPAYKVEKADQKVTDEFIRYNKVEVPEEV